LGKTASQSLVTSAATRKLKGPGVASAGGRPQGPPGPCHFNKEQTPPGICSIPARGFTAAVSVFGAHLLRSPWIVKSGADTLAPILAPDRPSPSVENLGSPAPVIDGCRGTPSRCRHFVTHSSFTFRGRFQSSFSGNKKPCLLAASRVWKSSIDFLPAYLRVIQIRFGLLAQTGTGWLKAKHTTLTRPVMTRPDFHRNRRHRRPARG
jgi:hypothetical protein